MNMLRACLSYLVLICISIPATYAAPSQPNIIIILVDDMGVMDTSLPFLTDAEGKPKRYPLNDYYRTPNMERLAANGIRFNNFCAMSVCSPTRVSIMTGQNAARHRTTNWIDSDKNNAGPQGPKDWNWQGMTETTVALPGLLQESGYRTIHVGKGHFAPREFDGADPRTIGFDINVAGSSIGHPGSYYGTRNFGNKLDAQTNKQASHGVPGLEKYHGQDIFLTEALTLEANAHVADAVKADQPFFLYFAQYAVHGPFNSDPRFATHYTDSGKPTNAQAFATLIEGMDKSLGDLIDELERLGIAENTLIFFLGDNGTAAPLGDAQAVACAAPLRGKKGTHYEGGMRVPFIAAWAKPNADNPFQKRLPISRGSIQSQLAAVYDLFPTLLALVGKSAPPDYVMDGARLDTLLAGKRDPGRGETFLMHYPHSPHGTDYFTTYRNGDWKVIYHYFPTGISESSHYQLFNLKADPFEQQNLAKTESAQLKRLMQELITGLETQHALYPVNKATGQPQKPRLP